MMTKFLRFIATRCPRLPILRFSAVIAGMLILLLFTGLFQQTQRLKSSRHYHIISQLRALERTDVIVMADALKIRLVLLPNYDTVVADSQLFHTQLTELAQELSPMLSTAGQLQQALSTLNDQALDRATLIEDLKSENAVLQNSVAYFPKAVDTLVNSLPEDELHYPLKASLNQLVGALLQHTLTADNSNVDNIEQIMAQVEALSNTQPITEDSAAAQLSIENIFRHVRAILYLKPQVTDAINLITAAPVGPAIEQLAASYEAYHQQLAQVQSRYRRGLYSATILLLAISGYLIWNYRHAAHLQKINTELSGLVADRTDDLQQTLETLKHSQSQLVQAEKMSALGQLSAGIAHEINNPISFIHGNVTANKRYSTDCIELLELYAQHYPHPTAEIEEYLDCIDFDFLKEDWFKLLDSMKIGTSRVQKIVESLRNFSRLDESGHKTVDLQEGIESTLLLLNHRLIGADHAPAIKVVKNYQPLPYVSCHPSAINQVFMNVLTNAIDAFSPEQPDPTITISTEVGDAQIAVIITDNGSGMSEEVKARIFDPFFTSKPVGQGTGLGLSVSYQTIVEAHAGSIDVTSTPGEGSSFRIQLPVKGAARKTANSADSEGNSLARPPESGNSGLVSAV